MRKVTISGLAALLALFSVEAFAQTISMPKGLAMPHLAKARAEAFKGDNVYFPALLACYGSGDYEENTKDPPPTKVFDNLYFVGTGDVAAWAVTTSAGIIVIDSLDDPDEAQKYIVGGMKTLGLNPADIKYVFVTHGHGDHFGGAKYLKETYGAHILVSREDWDFMQKQNAAGGRGPAEWAALVPDHDMDIVDGQKLTLGGETITMYVTPGHTPGAVSSLIPVTDHGVPHVLAFWGGFAVHGADAQAFKAYDSSIVRWEKIIKDAKVDGILDNHPAQDDTAVKLYHVRTDKNKTNAFLIGNSAAMRYYNVLRECNLNNADIGAAEAKRVPATR